MATDVTLTDMIVCVRLELAMRNRVYPKWVESRRMTQTQAERELRVMGAVLRYLEREAAAELTSVSDGGDRP